ncbi:hypothetical protein AC792_12070 [Arthrobacter sp. RIT-PI-e]|nr:hypothetical protein AC792_12070 [Arthrobacter sp. RIT-PI-e]
MEGTAGTAGAVRGRPRGRRARRRPGGHQGRRTDDRWDTGPGTSWIPLLGSCAGPGTHPGNTIVPCARPPRTPFPGLRAGRGGTPGGASGLHRAAHRAAHRAVRPARSPARTRVGSHPAARGTRQLG